MVLLKNQVIWDVTHCFQASSFLRFLWLFCVILKLKALQSFRTSGTIHSSTQHYVLEDLDFTYHNFGAMFCLCWRRRQQVVQKYQNICTILHGVIPNNTSLHGHCCENIKTHVKICICFVILCLRLETFKMGEEDDFTPRPYQEQLMNLVKEQNTIIYLPTGSGKTYIAVMLIKEMSASLDRWVISFQLLSGFLLG